MFLHYKHVTVRLKGDQNMLTINKHIQIMYNQK